MCVYVSLAICSILLQYVVLTEYTGAIHMWERHTVRGRAVAYGDMKHEKTRHIIVAPFYLRRVKKTKRERGCEEEENQRKKDIESVK